MSDERYWSEEELAQELLGRGCASTQHRVGRGRLWLNNNGEPFSVPPPPDSRGYPWSMVREILFFSDPVRIQLGIGPRTLH